MGVSEVASELKPSAKRHKASLQDDPREVWTIEAAFGLPWDVDPFVHEHVKQATRCRLTTGSRVTWR